MADSFGHFRLHFAAMLALCLFLLAFGWAGRLRIVALVSVAVIVAGLAWIWGSGPPRNSDGNALTLVQYNLLYLNGAVDGDVAFLRETGADVVTLQEVSTSDAMALTSLLDLYPHQRFCSFSAIGRVGILSKLPLVSEKGGCAEGLGLIWEQIETEVGPVTVASIHTHWPWPFDQHIQIDRMIPWLAAMKTPMIVGGDFNAAPWSHAVARIEQATRTEAVPGLRMTIGVRFLPLTPRIPIPIDHVLLSGDFCPLAARVGPKLGSDHYPVIVEIGPRSGGECG